MTDLAAPRRPDRGDTPDAAKPPERATRPWQPLKVTWQRRFSRPAALGLIMVVTAAVLALAVAPTLNDQALDLDARVDAARRQASVRAQAAPVAAPPRPENALPDFAQRSADLATLVEIAQASQVDLPRADYKLEPLSASRNGLIQWRLQLPVRGSYAQLRQFVAGLLNRLPHAALENLQIERTDTQQAELQSTLDLSLYYLAPTAAPRSTP